MEERWVVPPGRSARLFRRVVRWQANVRGLRRSGLQCGRYIKADLPLLNATSSASVVAVLAVGISLAVLGALLLGLAVLIIVRQQRQLRSYRRLRC